MPKLSFKKAQLKTAAASASAAATKNNNINNIQQPAAATASTETAATTTTTASMDTEPVSGRKQSTSHQSPSPLQQEQHLEQEPEKPLQQPPHPSPSQQHQPQQLQQQQTEHRLFSQQQQPHQQQHHPDQNSNPKMLTGHKRHREHKAFSADTHLQKKYRHSMTDSVDTDANRCVACRQPFQSVDHLLEHLSSDRIYIPDNSKSGSEKKTNLKGRCVVRDCFMCDFAPDLDTDLGSRYRTVQDHIITIHFKVSWNIKILN